LEKRLTKKNRSGGGSRGPRAQKQKEEIPRGLLAKVFFVLEPGISPRGLFIIRERGGGLAFERLNPGKARKAGPGRIAHAGRKNQQNVPGIPPCGGCGYSEARDQNRHKS